MEPMRPLPWGTHLAALRERSGMTQRQLAERAGVSLSAVQAWEQGVRLPEWDGLHSLCHALGVDPNELMMWYGQSDLEDGDPPPPKRPGRPRKK